MPVHVVTVGSHRHNHKGCSKVALRAGDMLQTVTPLPRRQATLLCARYPWAGPRARRLWPHIRSWRGNINVPQGRHLLRPVQARLAIRRRPNEPAPHANTSVRGCTDAHRWPEILEESPTALYIIRPSVHFPLLPVLLPSLCIEDVAHSTGVVAILPVMTCTFSIHSVSNKHTSDDDKRYNPLPLPSPSACVSTEVNIRERGSTLLGMLAEHPSPLQSRHLELSRRPEVVTGPIL